MTMFRSDLLKGKRILVTGGGTGLGREMADEYAKLGATVYICGRRGAVLEEAAKELSKANNAKVTALECDIRVADAVDDMMTRIFNEGPLDGLVNNAAGNFINQTQRLSSRAFDTIVDIVLKGSYNCTLALGKYWIDGAIEGLQGLARVFGPDGPCYECTLSEADLAQLGHRRSCALLSPEDLALGRTPTNATTASIIAGVEVQEAIKLLVGRPELLALEGKVWRLEGETMLTSTMEYVENDFCMAHDRVSIRGEAIEVSGLPQRVSHLIAEDPARGEFIAIDMPDDLIRIEPCSECGAGETILGLRPTLPLGAGRCDSCQADRPIASRTSLEADHPWIVDEWSTIRWPDAEIVGVRFSEDTIYEIVRSEA